MNFICIYYACMFALDVEATRVKQMTRIYDVIRTKREEAAKRKLQISNTLQDRVEYLSDMKMTLLAVCPLDFEEQVGELGEAINELKKEKTAIAPLASAHASEGGLQMAMKRFDRSEALIREVDENYLSEMDAVNEVASECQQQRSMALEMLESLRESAPKLSTRLLPILQEYLPHRNEDLGFNDELQELASEIVDLSQEGILICDTKIDLPREEWHINSLSTKELSEIIDKYAILYNQANEMHEQCMDLMIKYHALNDDLLRKREAGKDTMAASEKVQLRKSKFGDSKKTRLPASAA